jgi:hypothetical protein
VIHHRQERLPKLSLIHSHWTEIEKTKIQFSSTHRQSAWLRVWVVGLMEAGFGRKAVWEMKSKVERDVEPTQSVKRMS